ncbi:MAG: hypothetical protein JXA11_04670 [Phycisphaerae bacterium]|nr:hypothetical protein [Phycisphaerae bacterium]
MLRKALFLSIAVSLGSLVVGCGGGSTAAEIAQSYGILNRGDLQPKIAGVIQSGQANAMVAEGIAKKRHRVNGSGKGRVLVTEYLIEGEVYRVEVRRAIDPTMNIDATQIYYADSELGPKKQLITAVKLLSVWSTLKNQSFEARPEIAYRAWRDLKGQVHDVVVKKGDEPEWTTGDESLNLFIRTKKWPFVEMWFRGLTDDLRASSAGAGENDLAPDGRWITESAGEGVQGQKTDVNGQTYFINLKLADAIGA